ncbi:MAG TPA: DUF4388 domain-containing protein [Polyangiaceae bacterium]|nr:DUF4388 domain-containing protein [Polyangiaceae bacterium]
MPALDASLSEEDDASDGNARADAQSSAAAAATGPAAAVGAAQGAEHAGPQPVSASLAAQPDASKAPTLRPPPSAPSAGASVAHATLRMGSPSSLPAPDSSASNSPPPVPRLPGIPLDERDARDYRSLGFTSVVRHLSLRGWLRWIQSNECDATLRVRTRDGGSGCIWCSAGKVVDAEWSALSGAIHRAQTFSGEPALMELLRLESGSVSIDFDPVERPRRIARMTLPLELESQPAAPQALEPPAPEPRAPAPARGLSRSEYLAGGLLLAAFVLLAFAFGRQRGAGDDAQAMVVEPRRAQETQALLPPPQRKGSPSAAAEPKDLSLIRFATLEVEPAGAEIWLDHSLLGLGRVELAPLLDGDLHELRFVAAGRAPRSLYFVGSPPSGRVVLEQAEPGTSQAPAAGAAEPAIGDELSAPSAPQGAGAERSEASPAESAARAAPRAAPRRRVAPVAAAHPASPARSEGAAGGKETPGKKAPQIQLIEAHTPRVQVLD